MTEKRFYKQKSTIEDYMIYDEDKEDAYFVSCEDETNVDYLVDLLNEQDQKIKELKRMLQLVSEAETVRNENSVKEIVRNNLFGLDSVAGESANAFNDYLILNKFFKEYYNEHWDNDKFD